jgi:hypothetical protein
MRRTGLVFLAFLLLSLGASAQAASITSVAVSDCDADGCAGSDLFLSVEDEGSGSWLVTYRIDTAGYTGSRDGFNQIGFKAVSGWSQATLLSADGVWSDPAESPIASNSSCSKTKGNTSKVCIFGYVDITGGGEYTWKLRLEGGDLLEEEEWHLGAQYANAPGTARGRIISTSPAEAIPEPSAAVLFGVGFLVLRQARRR